MQSRNHSLGSGTPKVEQPGGPTVGSSVPGLSSPRGPGGAKVGSGKRLTPAAKQTVQMMLVAWALRELAARRAAQSYSRNGHTR